MDSFIAAWTTLSSDGLFGALIDIVEPVGKWAEAASKLIGLI